MNCAFITEAFIWDHMDAEFVDFFTDVRAAQLRQLQLSVAAEEHLTVFDFGTIFEGYQSEWLINISGPSTAWTYSPTECQHVHDKPQNTVIVFIPITILVEFLCRMLCSTTLGY